MNNYYDWHSLKCENPDLPENDRTPILVEFEIDNEETNHIWFGVWSGYLLNGSLKQEEKDFCIAWKYIEPFKED